VPTIVVSPWSRGGQVSSELFDHTSVVRFVEKRFGVHEPNVSAWRRSVSGDLSSAFDFSRGGAAPRLPTTDDFQKRIALSAGGSAIAIPAQQRPAEQMAGGRPARPLPYAFTVDGDVTAAGRFRLAMTNTGGAGVVLTVHDNSDRQAPWHYTIGAGHHHDSEQWHDAGPLADYDLSVRGPNGFFRRFAGSTAPDGDRAEVRIEPGTDGVATLRLINQAGKPQRFAVSSAAGYGDHPAAVHEVAAGKSVDLPWAIARSGGWYDLEVRLEGRDGFVRHFAGAHRNTATDPGIGSMRLV
jgi:phospholipase C